MMHVGDILSTVGEYRDKCWGYLEYRGGRGVFSTVGYSDNKRLVSPRNYTPPRASYPLRYSTHVIQGENILDTNHMDFLFSSKNQGNV